MIPFIIKYRNFILPALAIAAFVGGLLLYGNSQYQKGYKTAVSEFNLAENKALKTNANIWKGANREINLLKDDELDRAGSALGILRTDDNR